jgi:hypothetical protein
VDFFQPWPPAPEDKKKDIAVVALDFGEDQIDTIDTGVTSGADPSEWDPINVDEEGRVDSCVDANGAGAGTGPAICHTEKK